MTSPIVGRHIRVRGLVQGVGFRPHVWRLATDAGLSGHVLNDGAGVAIEIWGGNDALDAFLALLETEAPPLARIDAVEWQSLEGQDPGGKFRIERSAGGEISTGVVPDAATCPDCLAEIFDPDNRRFGYAFTNCTHCGPRLSIVQSIPYDRAKTSMAVFPMCEDCAREYEDPADRRFYAQPNACPVCGPRLWLEDGRGAVDCAEPIAEVARLLKGASKFGAELDSLSDFVCFGVSPGLVLYLWTLRDAGKLGWVLVMLFAICCGLRLARFNVMLEDPDAPPWKARFFTGVPAPAGGGLVLLPMVLSFQMGDEFFRQTWVAGAFLLVIGGMMVSTIPTYSFKNVKISRRWILPTMLIAGAIIIFLINAPWLTLSIIGGAYIASIPLSYRDHRKHSGADNNATG